MITEQHYLAIRNVVEKRKRDPLYKPSSVERNAIDAVLEADWSLMPASHGAAALTQAYI